MLLGHELNCLLSLFCQAQVQVQVRLGSGEGQEGQSQAKSDGPRKSLVLTFYLQTTDC